MAVRRQSQGFSRGTSTYRGVTHHPSGQHSTSDWHDVALAPVINCMQYPSLKGQQHAAACLSAILQMSFAKERQGRLHCHHGLHTKQ